MKQRFHIARHPAFLALVERTNCIIKEALRKQIQHIGETGMRDYLLSKWLRAAKAMLPLK